jgi:hypothetical protein
LACSIFAAMRLRNAYKNMLNNMISPIGYVIMNY